MATEPEIRCDHRRGRAGRAAARRPADRRRHDRRGDRAQTVRRHLRQHRLHPDQDPGRQRPRRPHGAPRRRFRRRHRRPSRRHEEGQGAQGRGLGRLPRRASSRGSTGMERLHRVPRPCPLRKPAHGRASTTSARGRANLPQRRRPRHRARHAGPRPMSTTSPTRDPRSRLAAAAIWSSSAAAISGSNSPRCTGASAPSHRHREGAAADPREDEDVSAAIKEILENEGITVHLDADCISLRKRRQRFRVTPRDGAARSPARTCCWRSGGGPTPTISASRSGRRDRRARLHRRRRPAADQRRRNLGDG